LSKLPTSPAWPVLRASSVLWLGLNSNYFLLARNHAFLLGMVPFFLPERGSGVTPSRILTLRQFP
jgi:hypothetical protein